MDVVREAVSSELQAEAQRATRTLGSERPQGSTMPFENEAVDSLLQRDREELLGALLDAAFEWERGIQQRDRRIQQLEAELERERAVKH